MRGYVYTYVDAVFFNIDESGDYDDQLNNILRSSIAYDWELQDLDDEKDQITINFYDAIETDPFFNTVWVPDIHNLCPSELPDGSLEIFDFILKDLYYTKTTKFADEI